MTSHRKSGYSADPAEGQGLLDLGALVAAPPGHADDTPKSTRGQKRIARQLQALRHGQHPLALNPLAVPTGRLKLHPDAADAADRTAPGLRCGTCRLRQAQAGGSRDYPKCAWPDPIHVNWPRATHGDGSDVRAWWPACVDYQPNP